MPTINLSEDCLTSCCRRNEFAEDFKGFDHGGHRGSRRKPTIINVDLLDVLH